MVQFRPPYPNREELFVPPSKEIRTTAESQGTVSGLRLVGIADMDGPRAILEIEGVVTTMTSGEERHGIKVVSIGRMEVVLERNGRTWTESLMSGSTGKQKAEKRRSQEVTIGTQADKSRG